MKVLAITAAALLLGATPALAYVGPGAGLSLLGAFWGLFVAVLAALAFVVVYPMRRLMRGRKRPAETLRHDQLRHDPAARQAIAPGRAPERSERTRRPAPPHSP